MTEQKFYMVWRMGCEDETIITLILDPKLAIKDHVFNDIYDFYHDAIKRALNYGTKAIDDTDGDLLQAIKNLEQQWLDYFSREDWNDDDDWPLYASYLAKPNCDICEKDPRDGVLIACVPWGYHYYLIDAEINEDITLCS